MDPGFDPKEVASTRTQVVPTLWSGPWISSIALISECLFSYLSSWVHLSEAFLRTNETYSTTIWGYAECTQKAHVLKACSPGWCYWEVVEALRSGPSGRKLGHWGCALERDIETSDSVFPSSFPATMIHHTLPAMIMLPCPLPKATRPVGHRLEPWPK
jgi:hypothetical protein